MGEKAPQGTLARVAIAVAAMTQISFAVLAFWDLAHRSPAGVRGPKQAWVPAILVNWIGPAAYFVFGIRR